MKVTLTQDCENSYLLDIDGHSFTVMTPEGEHLTGDELTALERMVELANNP